MRIQRICAGLSRKNLDALLVSSAENISYLTDYPSRDSYLLVSKKSNIYFTDSRYMEEAEKALKGKAVVRQLKGPLFQAVADACSKLGLRRVGFEEGNISYAWHAKIERELADKARLFPSGGIIEALREIKTAGEIKKIRKAASIAVEGFRFIKKLLSPGMKEIEAAAELERFIRYNGACASAFDIIVASGPNSSLPHHLTSHRKIGKNEPILIDMGVNYLGYKSDLTRVYFLGKITPAVAKIYDIVRAANHYAISRIKPSVHKNIIDAAARQYITRKGYGGFFGHSLGHGIGLETHEGPRISQFAKGPLKPGMVFTVEPGIYLPGRFGIRLEDMVLVTRKGCEVLSGVLDK
ncbi:MAG: aminopeptidase P family protein [Candidatus Omnitrophota bacterium]